MSKIAYSGDQAKLIQTFRDTKPTNREDLWNWIKLELGIHLPRVAVTDYTVPPFDAVADACLQKSPISVWVAPRSGGKTTGLGVCHIFNSKFYAGCQTGHLAAQQSQAKVGYNWFRSALRNRGLLHLVEGDPMAERTVFKNGAVVGIYTATLRGVNAPHVHKLVIDEVDQLKAEEIYDEAQGMTHDDEGEIKSQRIYASSWKRSDYLITRLMRDIPECVYRWSIYDVMKPCGKAGVDCADCSNIRKGNFTFRDFCQDRARNADGFLSRDWVWKAFQSVNNRVWISQYESKAPDIEDSVFSWFDTSCIVDEDYEPSLPVYLGMDFGMTDPSVALFCQKKGEVWYILDEIYVKNIFAQQFGSLLAYCLRTKEYTPEKAKAIGISLPSKPLLPRPFGGNDDYWGDPRGREQRFTIGKIVGKRVRFPSFIKYIEDGVDLINLYGERNQIKVNKRCINTIREFEAYQRVKSMTSYSVGAPKDVDNHAPDAFRYMLTGYAETHGIH